MSGYIAVRILTSQQDENLLKSPLIDKRLVVSLKDCLNKEVNLNFSI
jgi:hypothetical protein